AGAWVFKVLQGTGQVDLMISLAYVVFLTAIGGMMLVESARVAWRRWRGITLPAKRRARTWVDALPMKMRFRKSRQYVSVLIPLLIGALTGILVAIMGVGGGFIMVPAMIYLLHMPTNVVMGTSLFQITAVTASVTFLHAVNTQT